jgi:hypothetical protein
MSAAESRALCRTCVNIVGSLCKAGLSMVSSLTDSSICGSYDSALDNYDIPINPITETRNRVTWEEPRTARRAACQSCGYIFKGALVLDDELGSLIQVCPVCKSADIAFLDDFGFMPNKEAPHD